MRQFLSILAATVVLGGLSLSVRAAAADVKTITGEGQCAKCSLKETKDCVNAVVVEEGGKKVTYYMDMENKIAKAFHSKVCQDKIMIKVKGAVTEKDGKKIVAPTEEIEILKD